MSLRVVISKCCIGTLMLFTLLRSTRCHLPPMAMFTHKAKQNAVFSTFNAHRWTDEAGTIIIPIFMGEETEACIVYLGPGFSRMAPPSL